MKTINTSLVLIICLLIVYGCGKTEESSDTEESSQPGFLRPTIGVVEDPPLDPVCSDQEYWTVSCLDHCDSLHTAWNNRSLCLRIGQAVELQHTGNNVIIKNIIGDVGCPDDC